jgi:predicted phage tail protein
MAKRIILHGALKKLYAGEASFSVDTVAEAIKAFSIQCPAMRPVPGKERMKIRVAGFDTVESLFEPTDVEEIHLIQDFSGGKIGGFIAIILGIALIAVSFIPGLNVAVWGGAITWASLAFSIGASILLGGLSMLLSPAPARDTATGGSKSIEASKYLGAPKNTVAIGTRIIVAYGQVQVFGHYISFDVKATDVAV